MGGRKLADIQASDKDLTMAIHALIPPIMMVVLTLALLAVIVVDATHYIIPNTLNLALLAMTMLAMVWLPFVPLTALAAAGLVLAVGLCLFALGLMGGGDVKLLAVLTLWTGWSIATIQFLFLTAIAGGVLVVIILLLRAIVPPILFRSDPARVIPDLFMRGKPVPYGLAIAAGFLWMLWMGLVPVLR